MRRKAEPTEAAAPPAIVPALRLSPRCGCPRAAAVPALRLSPTEASRRWAALLQQIFEVDPLACPTCPTCHGRMRVVACITQTSVIEQILAHLRTRTRTRATTTAHAVGARSPPSTRAPAPRRAPRAPGPPAVAPHAP